MRRIRFSLLLLAVPLLFVSPIVVSAQIPIPAPVGGSLAIDGASVTQATDDGIVVSAVRSDLTPFDPPARDDDGLNASDVYLFNVPIYDAHEQPGGARPGDVAILQVTRNGQPLTVTVPEGGAFTVGESGSPVQVINIEAVGGGTPNRAPTADAGPDRTVFPGDRVVLDPSGSVDPDAGDALAFSWSQIDGPTVSLTGVAGGGAAFTAPDVSAGQAVALTFRLTATDGGGLSDTDDATVTVQGAANRPPVANAGPDQNVVSGARVVLDGGNSTDPDSAANGIETFDWRQISGASVSLISTGTPGRVEFVAPGVSGGGEAFVFELTVGDSGGLTGTDQVTVNVVVNGNHPPTADAGSNRSVSAGEVVALDGRNSSDPDAGDGVVGYAWRQLSGPAVLLADEDAALARFTAPAVAGGTSLTFELRVADSAGLQGTDSVTINVVSAENRPPSADAGPDQQVREGERVTLRGSNSSDSDGFISLFLWSQISGPAVVLDDAKREEPGFTAPPVGAAGAVLVFELTVVDDGLLETSDRTRVEVLSVGRPPVADAGADQTVFPGDLVSLDGGASRDEDGAIVSFQWRQDSGTQVQLQAANREAATFLAPAPGAPLVFALTVTDDDGLTDSDDVTVQVTGGALPPIADAGPDRIVQERAFASLDGSGSAAGQGELVSFQWRQLSGPAAILSDPAAPAPTFAVPAVDGPGVQLVFELVVVDSGGLRDADEVVYAIEDLDDPGAKPTANAGPDIAVREGFITALNGTRSRANQGTIVAYRWRQIAGPPATLSDPAAPRPTFTVPDVNGSGIEMVFELTVTDSYDLQDFDEVTYTIEEGAEDGGGGAGDEGGGCFLNLLGEISSSGPFPRTR